jgi:hypothetical protein
MLAVAREAAPDLTWISADLATLELADTFDLGFGLDAAHLPTSCPVTSLAEYDDACAAGQLSLDSRYATWDGDPFRGESGGYVVSVHHAAEVLR